MRTLQDVQSVYKDVVSVISQIDAITWEICTWSLKNELRYTSFHLVEACNEVSEEERQCHIDKAYNHCVRIKHDAYETLINYYLEEVDKFESHFENLEYTAEIQKLLPNYDEIRSKLAKGASCLIKKFTLQKGSLNEHGKWLIHVCKIMYFYVKIVNSIYGDLAVAVVNRDVNKEKLVEKRFRDVSALAIFGILLEVIFSPVFLYSTSIFVLGVFVLSVLLYMNFKDYFMENRSFGD